MPAPYPQTLPQAFAQNAAAPDRNTIPNLPVTTQRASFNLGFPPLTMAPVASGGKPMLGPDMNGILYMLSTHEYYQQSGMLYLWNADVVVSIGGYAIGTLLGSADGLTVWRNTVAGNINDPDVVTTADNGWVALFSYGNASISGLAGGVRVLTLTEAAKSVLVLTGALAVNQQIVLPTQLRRWLIVNACTGAFSLTVKTAAGTGVAVPQGGFAAPVEVYGDGTNIYNVVAPVNLPIDQAATPLTIVQRTNAGYVFATYFNQSSGLENAAMSAVFFEQAGDGYLRKMSPANFTAQIFANAALTGAPTAPTPPAGNSSTRIATTAFVNPPATVAVSGSQPYLSGLIMKWGSTGALGGGGGTPIVFPTPFPTACFNVQITGQNTGGVAQAADTVTNKTLAGFTLNNASNAARAFDWFALGN